MSAGFDAWFDAFARAVIRDDAVVTGAFAEPVVFFFADRTLVCPTARELLDQLAADRAWYRALGGQQLEWISLEARELGPEQHQVAVQWELVGASGPPVATFRVLYLMRGHPPEARITGVVVVDAPPAIGIRGPAPTR